MKLLKFEEFCQNLGMDIDNMFAKSSYESYLTSIKSKCKNNLRSIFIDFILKSDDSECKIVEDLINYIEDKYKGNIDEAIIALERFFNLYSGYDICNDEAPTVIEADDIDN